MKKTVMYVEDCNNGAILVKDVINSYGAVVVAKNTMINPYIKSKLISWGIEHICIYEPSTDPQEDNSSNKIIQLQFKYRNNIDLYKEFICGLAEGRKLDTEKLAGLSDFVIKNIDETDDIIHILDKVKTTDEYTHTHCLNVSFYAMLIGKWLKLSASDIKKLVSAGLLHDIGKMQIPLPILNKPGKLLPEEFEVIKQHPLNGYTILNRLGIFDNDVVSAVLCHHEREDGTGYPLKIKSEEINLYSKIIAIADVYDAITSERIYKPKATPFTAFKIFNKEFFNSLDLTIIGTFLKNLATFYIGSKVVLNSGSIGEIAFIPPNNIAEPIIRIEDTFYDLAKERDLEITSIVS